MSLTIDFKEDKVKRIRRNFTLNDELKKVIIEKFNYFLTVHKQSDHATKSEANRACSDTIAYIAGDYNFQSKYGLTNTSWKAIFEEVYGFLTNHIELLYK